MFYERYVNLCRLRGVSPSRAALDAGLSKAAVTKWKNEPELKPSAGAISKLAQYFGISISELLGPELETVCVVPQEADVPEVSRPFQPSAEYLAGESIPFYERLTCLCRRRGITPSRAAQDAGISKSTVTKWKNDPTARPSGTVLAKLTEYFGMTTSELLGEGVYSNEPRPVTDEEIKFALFGGSEGITQEMYDEVRSFAAFVKNRESRKSE